MAKPQARAAQTASITAPIGGWNARDSVSAMPATDAVTMVNFYPTPTYVVIGRGYTRYSQGINGRVNTLMTYAGLNDQRMFAAAGITLYRADFPTAVPVLTVENDKFQYVNFSNTSGNYMVACNGEETIIYDAANDRWIKMAGTQTASTISSITHVGTLATVNCSTPHGLITGNYITITGCTPAEYNGTFRVTVLDADSFRYTMATAPAEDATVVGTYTILFGTTGADPSKFIQVNLFKNRLYFVEKDTLNAWYLPLDSIGGEFKPLYFGGIATQGGVLRAMGTWTLDAGQGADDYAVWATSMGEVIVYNGTDPNDPAAWALKGVWQFGYVFNNRCFYKYGGDLLMLTQDGLVPLTGSLQSSRLDPRVFLTDKIFYEISQQVQYNSERFGWQILYYAKPNMLIVNIPDANGTKQFVMHNISKAWASFEGIDANCWELKYDQCYFGGDGYVGQFWESGSDDGKVISATCQQAYSYFDMPGQQKRFTLVRPTFFIDAGKPAYYAAINVDFNTNSYIGNVVFNPDTSAVGIWDVARWDQSVWGGNFTPYSAWNGVQGIGYAGGANISLIAKDEEIRWTSTDYVMEKGSVI